jgi:hypothetical protein
MTARILAIANSPRFEVAHLLRAQSASFACHQPAERVSESRIAAVVTTALA